MKLQYVLLACFVLVVSRSAAQDDTFEYKDKEYADNIRTVEFHVTGLVTSYPIMQLGSEGAL